MPTLNKQFGLADPQYDALRIGSIQMLQGGESDVTPAGGWPDAFPATPILDDFNRADGPLGSNWADYPLNKPLSIASQQVVSIIAAAGSMFYIRPLGADSEAYMTCVAIDDTLSALIGIGDSPLTNDIRKLYGVEFLRDDTGGDVITLYDSYSGSSVALGTASVNYSAGDAIGIRAVGTTIKAYYKPVGGAWGEVISANVSAFGYSRGSGYAVIYVAGSGAVDDFGGGPLSYGYSPAPAVYSSIVTTSVDITLDNSHHIVLCDSALTVNLPATTTYPMITYTIVRTGTGDVVIQSNVIGENISGAYPSITLDHQWQGVTIVADGYGSENWIVVDKFLGQETTGVTGASFTQNAGSDINDASTLDGYTLPQVVAALRNLGLLA